MVVHDVEMDEVCAGSNNRLYLFTQTGEVGGQDAGRDAMGHGEFRVQFGGILPVLAVQ
jgi:hypothetical protein